MGKGRTRKHEEFPGAYGDSFFGEDGQRAFYQRWLEFMTSEGWPVITEAERAAFNNSRMAK